MRIKLNFFDSNSKKRNNLKLFIDLFIVLYLLFDDWVCGLKLFYTNISHCWWDELLSCEWSGGDCIAAICLRASCLGASCMGKIALGQFAFRQVALGQVALTFSQGYP